MTNPKEVVVDVDFYERNNVPKKIREDAYQTETDFTKRGDGLEHQLVPKIVSVKTVFVMSEPVRIKYVIEDVGSTPAEIKAYMHKLAKDDGCDLNEAVKRAFGDDDEVEGHWEHRDAKGRWHKCTDPHYDPETDMDLALGCDQLGETDDHRFVKDEEEEND